MTSQTKTEPNIPALHPRNDGFVQSYVATWTEGNLVATVILDTVEPGHSRRGARVAGGYELSATFNHVAHRPLTLEQQEQGADLMRKLRERMLAAMQEAGWQQVSQTRDGLPIWKHQPGALVKHAFSKQEVGIVSDQARHQSRTYAVYGDGTKEEKKAARKSGQKPAYTREVSTKTVTFACSRCGNTVAEEHLPGAKPQYCH